MADAWQANGKHGRSMAGAWQEHGRRMANVRIYGTVDDFLRGNQAPRRLGKCQNLRTIDDFFWGGAPLGDSASVRI